MNTAELFGQTFSLSLMDCTAHLPRSSENGLSALQLPLLMLLLAGVSGAVRAISSVRISLSSSMTCSAQAVTSMNTAELFGQTFSRSLINCTVRICLKSSENDLSAFQRPLLMLLLAGVSGAVGAISSVRISLSSSMTCSLEDAGKLASDLVEGHGHARAIAPPPILAYGDTLSSVGLSAGFSTLLLSIFFDVRCLQLSATAPGGYTGAWLDPCAAAPPKSKFGLFGDLLRTTLVEMHQDVEQSRSGMLHLDAARSSRSRSSLTVAMAMADGSQCDCDLAGT
ncbi:unnamed protein product, partial [Symbiodinium necroappetens]